MKIWWSSAAMHKYLAYENDEPVRKAFDSLLKLVARDQDAGEDLSWLLGLGADAGPGHARLADALRGLPETQVGVRCSVQEVRRPAKAAPPPVLAFALHCREVPRGVEADHALLALGLILRQRDARV